MNRPISNTQSGVLSHCLPQATHNTTIRYRALSLLKSPLDTRSMKPDEQIHMYKSPVQTHADACGLDGQPLNHLPALFAVRERKLSESCICFMSGDVENCLLCCCGKITGLCRTWEYNLSFSGAVYKCVCWCVYVCMQLTG